MADVFTVLASDHAEAKALLAELESGPTKAGGADQHQLDLRKRVTQALIIEESRHEAVEEMYFWPAVRGHHAAGDTLADEATAQEKQAKHILAAVGCSSPRCRIAGRAAGRHGFGMSLSR